MGKGYNYRINISDNYLSDKEEERHINTRNINISDMPSTNGEINCGEHEVDARSNNETKSKRHSHWREFTEDFYIWITPCYFTRDNGSQWPISAGDQSAEYQEPRWKMESVHYVSKDNQGITDQEDLSNFTRAVDPTPDEDW